MVEHTSPSEIELEEQDLKIVSADEAKLAEPSARDGSVTTTNFDQLKRSDEAADSLRYGEAKSEAPFVPDHVDTQKSKSIMALPGFPHLFARLALALFITSVLELVFKNGSSSLLVHVPMQLFWTNCIYRYFAIANSLDEKESSQSAIISLSLISFLFTPLFPAPFVGRFSDPWFWCWGATQFIMPWMVGRKIDAIMGNGKPVNGFILTALCNFYLLCGALKSDLITVDTFFNCLWLFSQLLWFSVARRLLEKCIEIKRTIAKQALTASQINQRAFIAGTDIELRYRAFPSIERWAAQRFSRQNVKKGSRLLLMWVAVPAAVIVGIFLTVNYANNGLNTFGHVGAVSNAESVGRVSDAFRFYSLMFALVIACSIFSAIKFCRSLPTHLVLNAHGLSFAWKRKLSNAVKKQIRKERSDEVFRWSDIAHIGLERPSGEASTLKDAIVFKRADGRQMKVRLNSFDSFEDKEWILKAIKTWAPNVQRDAVVLQSLEPPADYSYTELWLQALSAPPQRERLKPLVGGVKLKQGQYVVDRSIGVGGQGQAYLAVDTFSGGKIVLKEFILPVYVDMRVRKSALEQFENEARILRHLDNPQVVKLLDYFVEDHRAYLVLEHIDGSSLRKLVEDKGPMPEDRVRQLAAQMCGILAYLHNLAPPVVHRDFTPDNLILNHDGKLKLIDFNVAQQQESTTSGTVVGKHAYLPPEQFRGMPTSQSDIYAMGATLFYLLTGSDPEAISRSHPRKANEMISESFDRLVAKATAVNVKDRYEHIENLEQDL